MKTSAYIQAWFQKDYSKIVFGIAKTLAWSPDTNEFEKIPRRHAHLYVFSLYRHKEQDTIDSLDVKQWEFFVVPTPALDARFRNEKSITLRGLEKIAGPAVSFESLAGKVREAARKR